MIVKCSHEAPAQPSAAKRNSKQEEITWINMYATYVVTFMTLQ